MTIDIGSENPYTGITELIHQCGSIEISYIDSHSKDQPGRDLHSKKDESSFWIALRPSQPDAVWTNVIREKTPEDTVVIAQKPGVQLSALVSRSMYIPSDLDAGHRLACG